MEERYFTLQEANALIPWVREKLFFCREANRFMKSEIKRMRKKGALKKGAALDNTPLPPDYFKALWTLYKRMNDVETAGIIVRDLETGLIDFPCLAEGRTVFLCWRFGEGRIDFWHEEDAGFAGRQPLTNLHLENLENEEYH